MTKTKYWLRKTCSFLIGMIFFCSGILKLLDPVGAGLVVDSYFKFFHVAFLGFSAKAVAVILALSETLIGTSLIVRIWRRQMAYLTSAFIGFFTLISILLVIFNPDMDCGCFGEAIHLTHWQTLFKNLILCGLAAAAFLPFKEFGHPKRKKYVSFALVTGAVLLLSLYSLFSIPLIDFTPFNVDSELTAAQNGKEGDFDEYYSTFIYEKDGETGAFTLDNLPDSTWKYVRTQTIRKDNPFAKTNINNLSFSDVSGNYKDDSAGKGKVMIVSAYDPDKLDKVQWSKIASFLSNSQTAGFKPLLLLSSTPHEFEKTLGKTGLGQSDKSRIMIYAYFSDYKTLISLNRSNGGATYFYEGEVVSKWARRALPGKSSLQGISDDDQNDLMLRTSTKGRVIYESFLFYVFMTMIFI